jgi:glycosyltransferase involved in cell wall biosynthesis
VSERIVLATTAVTAGGVWRHVRDLAEGLSARGARISIALEPAAQALSEEAARASLAVTTLDEEMPKDSLLHVHLADTFDRRATMVIQRHRRRGPVVVTEHLPRTNASDPSLLPGGRTPGAATAKALLKRVQYSAVDQVIAVGGSSAEFLRRKWRLPDRKISVVRNGVDAAGYPELPRAPDDMRSLVTLGTLNVQKGHDVLLDALERTRHDWRATLVGEGPQRPNLERRAASLSRGEVRLAGWQDDPTPVVARCELVCMPSRWESFPYAALEAGLWGRPLLATAVDGPDEIVEHGMTGLLTPPEDPVALAAALDRLAESPAEMTDMGVRARQHVRTRYTLDGMVAATAEVYAKAAAARR